MGTARTLTRQPAPPAHTPAAPTPVRPPAVRATASQLLQRRLGNEGAAAFISQNVLQVPSHINAPHDQEHINRPLVATSATPSLGAAPGSAPPASAPAQTARTEAAVHLVESPQKTTPTNQVATAGAPAVQQRAPAPAGGATKTAAPHAVPVESAHAEPGSEKKKIAAPSPRAALAPLITTLRNRAHAARKHSLPRVPVASAQAAAIRSKTEQSRAAAVQTVANLAAAKTRQIKKDTFKESLKKAIDATTQTPKTESEADEVMKTGASKASSTVKGELSTQNQAAAGELKSANIDVPASDQQEVKEVVLKPEPLGAAPAPVTAEAAVPPPLPAEQLDYSSDRAPTDKAMADAGVTKEQLEQGNEPEFKAHLAARSDAEKHEVAAVQSYRKAEAGIREHTEQSAQTGVSQGLVSIHAARIAHIGKVVGQQQTTRDRNAAEHQRITERINEFKNQTRKDVEEILKNMEDDAGDIFEKGLADAEKAYEETFKEEKGGTWTWLTTWGSSWRDLIERSLKKAHDRYLDKVYEAIDAVADCVDARLDKAKRRVNDGHEQIETFVKGLDESVRGFGESALKSVETDFEQMTGEIDQHRDALVSKLTQQYKASSERMSAMEEKLREENKSLWDRIYDATVGLIKKILAFKDMLLNVLARAADTIGTIIAHPIAFLGNLVDAGKLGFTNFVDRIGEYLKQGFMEWLFGAVAETGIQLPKNFDLAGILSLVLQVLGLTYPNIRSRAVKILGEKVVKALETAAEIFKILITKGPAGLWEYIKDKLGDLKAMVIDKIKSFIMEKVIMAGVTWIIGLLNPASAFFKACKAIYDIVMFFISHGKQILDLVNAVIDSVSAIAKGAIGAAATWVEKSLARTIPVIIGFLAALLGVGGISEKIKEVIEAVRKPINEAIDWVITKAVDLVKAVGGLLGFGEKKEDKKDSKKHDGVIGMAQQAVHERLNGDVSVDKVDKVLPEILRELQPMGLKSLALGHPNTEGTYEVLAEASPQTLIASLIAKRVIVGVVAKIQIIDDKPLLEGITRGPKHPNEEAPISFFRKIDPKTGIAIEGASPLSKEKQELLQQEGGTGNAAMLPSVGNLQNFQPQAGYIVEPAAGQKILTILSWNSSQPVRGKNLSHAEKQALAFLQSRPKEWLKRVKSIKLEIEGKAICEQCQEDLEEAERFFKEKNIEFDWSPRKAPNSKKEEELEIKK